MQMNIFGVSIVVDLNERAREVHRANEKWWRDLETGEPIERNKGEFLMLVISELAEAMEGERKNLMDTHLPHRKMAEVEMVDAYIRLLDYAGGFDIDISSVDEMLMQPIMHDISSNKGESLFQIVTCLSGYPYGYEEEIFIVNSIAMIMAHCMHFEYDLEAAYHEKMAYNATREDHKREARMQANGKKF